LLDVFSGPAGIDDGLVGEPAKATITLQIPE
jgi:hypothetical protein